MSKLLLDPAAQLVLHPAMSQTLKVLATTTGRDKLYRGMQYFSRFFAYVLMSRGYKIEAARWDALKTNVAGGRKVLRLGKFLEHLQSALRIAQSTGPSDLVAITQMARQFAYTGFLFFDSLTWMANIRFVNLTPTRTASFSKLTNRFWLAGISLSLIHSLQKFSQLSTERKKLKYAATTEKDLGSEAERKIKIRSLKIENTAVQYQLAQDLLDWWIPANNLGIVSISDGTAGLFGTITSVIGLYLHAMKVVGAKS